MSAPAPQAAGGDAPGGDVLAPASTTPTWVWTLLGAVVVFALAAATRYLESAVPEWTAGTALGDFSQAVEYPVYAIILGFVGNALLSVTGLRERLSGAFKAELLIKTGLVLLGAGVLFGVIVTAAGPAILQALVVVTSVFAFTWWLGGRLGLDDKLRALISSAVSICGVSAAIAAAGAVEAKKEQLAYTASLVIVFAVPSIFILPVLVEWLGLSNEVAGAWIGGNIDTTAAVAASGAIVGEEALQIATIVKSAQNVLMGVVAVALTAYFAFRIDRSDTTARPTLGTLWQRFPKFVLGFLIASVIATVATEAAPEATADGLATARALRDWFLIGAFVSIGLEFKIGSFKEAGVRPVTLFAAATIANLTIALATAVVLFGGVSIG